MAEAVLDASAVLAVLRREPGAEFVEGLMARSVLCSVNLAEVVSKLVERGAPIAAAVEVVRNLPYRIVAFDEELALSAGVLWSETRPAGLSLGDRACLALARRESLPALTTDREWSRPDLNITVRLVR